VKIFAQGLASAIMALANVSILMALGVNTPVWKAV